MAENSGQLSLDGPAGARSGEVGTPVAGLGYVPGWLAPGPCGVLLAEIDAAPWSAELRRRVQHYGHRYDYGRRSVARAPRAADPAPALPGWARRLAARLAAEDLMDREADQVIVNEYRPGQGIGPHVDCVPCFGPVVAALSLGSGCVMDFTRPGPGAADGARAGVYLAAGSLCVMTGPPPATTGGTVSPPARATPASPAGCPGPGGSR